MKRSTQYLIAGVVIAIIAIFVYMRFKNKSSYSYPPMASETAASSNTFSTNLNNCEIAYLTQMNDATLSATADATRTACISSNVSTYINARCPFLPTDPTSAFAITNGTGLVGTTNNAAYTSYLTDVTAVNTPYLALQAAETDANVLNYIVYARNADLTGPTRKFYSTLCPGVYNTSNTSDTVTSTYTGWTSSAGSGAAYGFNSTNVSRSRIIEWAKYAAQPATISTGSNGQLTLNDPPSSPLTSSCVKFSQTTSPNTDANYLIARSYGPGSIVSTVTLPWNTIGQAGC